MILQKTAKALAELQPGSRSLPQRARTVLLLAGGKTVQELHGLLGGDHAAVVQVLVAQGYLVLTAPHAVPNPLSVAPAPASAPGTSGASGISVAGTRMYLFNLCERLFAKHQTAQADALRTQLRESRDLAALRCAGLSLLDAVQTHAGEARAAVLRKELSALLDDAPQALAV